LKWCPRKLELSPCCKGKKKDPEVIPKTLEEKVEEAVEKAQIDLKKELEREPNTGKKRKYCCIS